MEKVDQSSESVDSLCDSFLVESIETHFSSLFAMRITYTGMHAYMHACTYKSTPQ